MAAEGAIEVLEVGSQLGGGAVAVGGAAQCFGESMLDDRAPDAVGLVRVGADQQVRMLGQVSCGDLEEILGNLPDAGADAQLLGEVADLLDEEFDGTPTLEVEDGERGAGRDVGVAVPVAADPGAEADWGAVGVEPFADVLEDGGHVVEELGHGVPDRLVDVVEDEAGLVEGVGSVVADLVGLPHGLDELVDAPVDARLVGRGAPRLGALLDEVGDAGQLVEDRPTGGLGGVGGEDGLEVDTVDEGGDVGGRNAGVDQPAHGLVEVAVGAGAADVEVLDAVDLLGDVGEVEVHGEGADQLDGLVGVSVGQEAGELGGAALAAAFLAEVPGEATDLFDGLEQGFAVLADEGVAELVAESADVGTQGGVGPRVIFGGVGGRVRGLWRIVGHAHNLSEPVRLKIFLSVDLVDSGWNFRHAVSTPSAPAATFILQACPSAPSMGDWRRL